MHFWRMFLLILWIPVLAFAAGVTASTSHTSNNNHVVDPTKLDSVAHTTTATRDSTTTFDDDYYTPLILSLLAGLSTCLGAAVVFCASCCRRCRRHHNNDNNNSNNTTTPPLTDAQLAFSLALAASVMVTVSFCSILPESFRIDVDDQNHKDHTNNERVHVTSSIPPILALNVTWWQKITTLLLPKESYESINSIVFWERCTSLAVGCILYRLLSKYAFPEPEEILGFGGVDGTDKQGDNNNNNSKQALNRTDRDDDGGGIQHQVGNSKMQQSPVECLAVTQQREADEEVITSFNQSALTTQQDGAGLSSTVHRPCRSSSSSSSPRSSPERSTLMTTGFSWWFDSFKQTMTRGRRIGERLTQSHSSTTATSSCIANHETLTVNKQTTSSVLFSPSSSSSSVSFPLDQLEMATVATAATTTVGMTLLRRTNSRDAAAVALYDVEHAGLPTTTTASTAVSTINRNNHMNVTLNRSTTLHVHDTNKNKHNTKEEEDEKDYDKHGEEQRRYRWSWWWIRFGCWRRPFCWPWWSCHGGHHQHHPTTPYDWHATATPEARRAWRVTLLLFVSLAVHNFPEGLAVAASSMHSPHLGVTTAIAIALHNIPEGIAIAVPCLAAKPDHPWLAFGLASLSGLAEPLGAAVALLLLDHRRDNQQQQHLEDAAADSAVSLSWTAALINSVLDMKNTLAFVAGIMIMVAWKELFPEAIRHCQRQPVDDKSRWIPLWFGSITGFVIMVTSDAYLDSTQD